MRTLLISIALTWIVTACASFATDVTEYTTQDGVRFQVVAVTEFDEPWAMTFLPDGRLLVTEKPGRLLVVTQNGQQSSPIEGVPQVDYGGQGGFGDVILHPDYANNNIIYLSYAEAGEDDVRGAAVARAKLELNDQSSKLRNLKVIWRQQPKVSGRGHYGHRLAFAADGKLFITSGERQKFDPAQDMRQNLGKIIRLNDDGSVPQDNPFADRDGVTAQIWSLGHRNPLGLAFDARGQLWSHEMGPRGGDELNRIVRGENYGYPIVSNGRHYDGRPIPNHDTHPEFHAPSVYWVPVISPAGFVIYSGDLFPDWQGDGFIGGLSSRSLVRVSFDAGDNGDKVQEIERFNMGRRIREVEQGPNGAIWLLEDRSGGRLLKITPAP
ncbi:MAG: PQQ-dependent sugar dehydrogenase [Candidatus Tectomicrobia bacterium]|nr:PQQ-dependent sugar dehydrogenase [Candidatus Tectomicrobia bacterium]